MRQHPRGYYQHPIWLAFELWADQHFIGDEYEEDWRPWWECFLAGYEIGQAEAA